MAKLTRLTPVWAVGPECDCISITPVRYTNGSFAQWGVQVCGMRQTSFIAISPLIIKVVDEISIGTDAREHVFEDALQEICDHFSGTPAIGCFHSGPLTGLFPHSNLNLAVECLHDTEGGKKEVWEQETTGVLQSLVHTFNIPFLRFKTYDEVRGRCGIS